MSSVNIFRDKAKRVIIANRFFESFKPDLQYNYQLVTNTKYFPKNKTGKILAPRQVKIPGIVDKSLPFIEVSPNQMNIDQARQFQREWTRKKGVLGIDEMENPILSRNKAPLKNPRAEHSFVTETAKEPKPIVKGRIDQQTQRAALKNAASEALPVNTNVTNNTVKDIADGKVSNAQVAGTNATKYNPKHFLEKRKLKLARKLRNSKRSLRKAAGLITQRSNFEELSGSLFKPSELFKKDISRYYNKAKAFVNNPWTKRFAAAAASLTLFNFAAHQIKRMFDPEGSALPSEYERGYDIIKENITDFGSPVSLAKSAQKVLMPYYSTVRRGARTTINSVINNNTAINLSKNAIKHTQY